MKEYDIFLKRRLTEGTIVINSLPFRDGVSAVSRVILETMLSYFTLQKKIAVASESSLVSEVDDMLATAYSKMHGCVRVDSSVAFSVDYKVDTDSALIGLDVQDVKLFAQSLMAFENCVGVSVVGKPIAYAKSSLGDAKSKVQLSAESTSEGKQVFDKIKSDGILDAAMLSSWMRSFATITSSVTAEQTSPELLYRYTIGMEQAFSIAAKIGETEFHYPLGDGQSRAILDVSKPATQAEKKIEIKNAVVAFCDLTVDTISFLSFSENVEVRSSLKAGMKRCRMLFELDGGALSEFDAMTLEELDFVVLA